MVEGCRLDSAATRLGGTTLSMLTAPSRPHQVFPLLKAKGKETEWFCRALTFELPQFSGQADQCHRHISRVLALLLEFYVTVARGGPSATRQIHWGSGHSQLPGQAKRSAGGPHHWSAGHLFYTARVIFIHVNGGRPVWSHWAGCATCPLQ